MTAANPWQLPKPPPSLMPTEFRCTVVGCLLTPAWLSLEHGRRCELHRPVVTFARRETPDEIGEAR